MSGDLFRGRKYFHLLDGMEPPQRVSLLRRWATEDELRDVAGMGEDKLAELEATCQARELEAMARAEGRERERAKVREQIMRLQVMRAGAFPERILRGAIGVVTDGDLVQPTQRDTGALRHAESFVASRDSEQRKDALLLLGGPGAGKTHAATWAAFRAGGARPGFIASNTLERRARYDRDMFRWIEACSMLVVDDVGAEPLDQKGYFCALLDEVIDYFYRRERMIVITTNLRARKRDANDQDQFIERYGERTWSRICQVAVIGNCGNHDLRRERPAN